MTKTAIFVEGQTELIIVREFLLKWFDYGIGLNCYNLFNKNTLAKAEYEHKNPAATQFFLIINVGNDNAVLSRLLEREANLLKKGFTKIIALRDMYSYAYRKVVKDHTIKPEINERFIKQTKEEIQQRSSKPNKIHFHYAIMEIETWLFGLTNVFQKVDKKLTREYIVEKTNYNIDDDPEVSLFHPSKTLSELLETVDKSYNKSKAAVSSFENHTTKLDYEDLFKSPKCKAFKQFVNSLLNS